MIDGIHTTICNSIWYAGASKTKSNLILCRFSFDAFFQQVAVSNLKFMYADFIFFLSLIFFDSHHFFRFQSGVLSLFYIANTR